MRYHVWGTGAPSGDTVERGAPTDEAFTAALASRSGWDPREHSSWAVTLELPPVAVEALQHDPAVLGCVPA